VTRGALLLLAGAGLLLGTLPAQARVEPSPGGGGSAEEIAAEQSAVALLTAAVSAARARSYAGTQYVATYRSGRAASRTMQVRHVPGSGVAVSAARTAAGDDDGLDGGLRTDVLDERLVDLLARHHVLAVSGADRCAGRHAHVVEVRRSDAGSDAAPVAGRFWLDRDSGLVLRREVYDSAGRTIRSSAYLDLQVSGQPVDVRAVSTTSGEVLDPAVLGAEWPTALPGFELVEARRRDVTAGGRAADVVHLAYSDGLSMLSVFAQDGRLDEAPGEGFTEEHVAGRRVWVRGTAPERVVWSAAGRTWTLLSDAPPETVRAVVAAMPHDEEQRDGVLDRVGRGAARVGSWLNPFG
jgi:sigma-E factor negative regulatory protein RseB